MLEKLSEAKTSCDSDTTAKLYCKCSFSKMTVSKPNFCLRKLKKIIILSTIIFNFQVVGITVSLPNNSYLGYCSFTFAILLTVCPNGHICALGEVSC